MHVFLITYKLLWLWEVRGWIEAEAEVETEGRDIGWLMEKNITLISRIWPKTRREGHWGEDVCWCILFELLTLLARAQAHTDIGVRATESRAHCSESVTHRWRLETWTTRAMSAQQDSVWHLRGSRRGPSPAGLSEPDLNHPCIQKHKMCLCFYFPHCVIFKNVNHKLSIQQCICMQDVFLFIPIEMSQHWRIMA